MDLHTPSHQPLISIIVVFWNSFGGLIRSFWPVLVLFFLNSNSGNNWFFIFGSIGLALISFCFGLVRYYQFMYHVADNNLVITSGLFTRVTRNIPFERIQSIRLEQKFIHRLLNLYSLKIDTAGTSKEEIEIPALHNDEANEIKNYIAAHNQKKRKQVVTVAEEIKSDMKDKEELVFRLKLWDIFLLGITGNHIRNFFLIVGGLFAISAQLGEFDARYRIDRIFDWLYDKSAEVSFEWRFLLIIPFAIIISILFSMGGSIFRNYDLKVNRSKSGYRVNQGLINRKEQFAPFKKIQIFRWSISPLRRLLGLYNIRIKQASSNEVGRNQAIQIPGALDTDVDRFLVKLFPTADKEARRYFFIHEKFLYRMFLFLAVGPAVLFSGIYFFIDDIKLWILAIGWLIIATLSIARYFNRYTIRLGESYLQLDRGIINDYSDRIFIHKMQGMRIHQTPYQVRNALASITLYTAAGDLTIPYLTLADAKQMSNYLLYKVESSKRAWM